MILNKVRLFFWGVLFVWLYIHAIDWDIQTRFALGPAWHQIFLYQTYTLVPGVITEAIVPQAESFVTNYDTLPYFEGSGRCWLGNHVSSEVCLSGGFLHKGYGNVNYFVDFAPAGEEFNFQFVRTARTEIDLIVFDINVGYSVFSKNTCWNINPLVGYVRNSQNINFSVKQSPLRYVVHNNWHGPYIGLEAFGCPCSTVLLRAFYKCVIGKESSWTAYKGDLFLDSGENAFTAVTDPSYARWHGSVIGNLFGLEAQYMVWKDWNIGTNIQYWLYDLQKTRPLSFDSIYRDVVYTAACIKKLKWQQVVWTFFVEVVF